jgi:uncharacterized protein YjiS (DUF1127 family)
MTVIPLDVTRFPELFEVHFLRWLETKHVELEMLSDEEIKDIGLEPPRRDFDTVKPFWMP